MPIDTTGSLYRRVKYMEKRGSAYRPKVNKSIDVEENTQIPWRLFRNIRFKLKCYPPTQIQSVVFFELLGYVFPVPDGGVEYKMTINNKATRSKPRVITRFAKGGVLYQDGERDKMGRGNDIVVPNLRTEESREKLLYIINNLKYIPDDPQTVQWNRFLDIVWKWFNLLPESRGEWYNEVELGLKR